MNKPSDNNSSSQKHYTQVYQQRLDKALYSLTMQTLSKIRVNYSDYDRHTTVACQAMRCVSYADKQYTYKDGEISRLSVGGRWNLLT